MTTATPTPLDVQWLQQEIQTALTAGTAGTISLPRATVELVACVLDGGLPGRPALASRYSISPDDLQPAVLDELRRLARHGEAPSKARWDVLRSSNLPSAAHTCRVLGVNWPQLVVAAGLQLNPHARRFAPADTGELPPDEPRPPVLTEDDYDVLPIAAKRTETRTVGQVRVTSTYYTLR